MPVRTKLKRGIEQNYYKRITKKENKKQKKKKKKITEDRYVLTNSIQKEMMSSQMAYCG